MQLRSDYNPRQLCYSNLPGPAIEVSGKTIVVHRIVHRRRRDYDIIGFILFDMHDKKAVLRRNKLIGYLMSKGLNIHSEPAMWAISQGQDLVVTKSDLERFSIKVSKIYKAFNRRWMWINSLDEFPEFKEARFEGLRKELDDTIKVLEKRYKCSIEQYLYSEKPISTQIKS